jgi:hypothetical protein
MKCNVTIDGVTWKNVNIDYSMFRDFEMLYFKRNASVLITPVDEPISKTDEMIIQRIRTNLINNGRWNK